MKEKNAHTYLICENVSISELIALSQIEGHIELTLATPLAIPISSALWFEVVFGQSVITSMVKIKMKFMLKSFTMKKYDLNLLSGKSRVICRLAIKTIKPAEK